MRPIEQMLLGLSGRDHRDIRPLQAAHGSIERVRRLLWHGRPRQADEELVRLAYYSGNFTLRGSDPEQMMTRDLQRHGSELRGHVQNNRRSIVS